MSDNLERARACLAEALGIAPDEIADDAAMDNTDKWDSLAHMNLILAVEKTIGREIDPIALVEMSSLRDIAEILDNA